MRLSIKRMSEIVNQASSEASWETEVRLHVKIDGEEYKLEFDIYNSSYVRSSGPVPYLMHSDEADVGDRSVCVEIEDGCLYGCTAMWYEVEGIDF